MSKGVYYNDIDPHCCDWIRNLISEGELPAGCVECEDIDKIDPEMLVGFNQCHFFAGIGGWALAAKWAYWPDELVLWSGSCPCQPFSTMGLNKGMEDDRNLWPSLHRLINKGDPDVFVGEQVSSSVGKGWLDYVIDDLEESDYSCWPLILPVSIFGAPHERERLYLLADSNRRDDKRRQSEGGRLRFEKSIKRTDHNIGGPSTDFLHTSCWGDGEWREGCDGTKKWVKPGVCPTHNGVSRFVGQMRAYGNAIVPQAGAAILGSYLTFTD